MATEETKMSTNTGRRSAAISDFFVKHLYTGHGSSVLRAIDTGTGVDRFNATFSLIVLFSMIFYLYELKGEQEQLKQQLK